MPHSSTHTSTELPGDHTPNSLPTLKSIKSYVVRGGRVTKAQSRALAELSSQWVVPNGQSVLNSQSLFNNKAPLFVEVGCGMGHATWQIAKKYQENNYLGIEVHPPGIGAMLNHIHEHQLQNLKLLQADATEVLRERIADGSLAGVNVFFPDPWPKKRHHKRRIVQPEWVAMVAAKLQVGGILHCATDWQPYAEHMLLTLQGQHNLVNCSVHETGYAARPDSRPVTKFERRGLALGHKIYDLIFIKQGS